MRSSLTRGDRPWSSSNNFPGAAMRRLDYAHALALLFIGCCGAVGAVCGLIYGMVRKGERDGAC